MTRPALLRLAVFLAYAAASSVIVGCWDDPVVVDGDDAYWWLDEPAFADVLDEIDVEGTLALGHPSIVVMKSKTLSGEEAYKAVGEQFGPLQEHNAREHPKAYGAFIDAYNEAMAEGDQRAIDEMIEHSRTEQCPSHAIDQIEP